MNKAPVLKGSGLAPIDDEPVHVFGRNLESRVVDTRGDENKQEEDDKEKNENNREDEDTNRIENKQEEDDVETIKKRKFDAITGEEDEETVFHGEFKLFVWDVSSSNWIEKGRGQLKLNDHMTKRQSRLIMRAGGTFRIILNVAIRHSLFKVISNTKTSIRFSDSQNVWAASGSNAKQLGDLLNDRIDEADALAKAAGTPEPAETPQPAETPKPAGTPEKEHQTRGEDGAGTEDAAADGTGAEDREAEDTGEGYHKDETKRSKSHRDEEEDEEEEEPHKEEIKKLKSG